MSWDQKQATGLWSRRPVFAPIKLMLQVEQHESRVTILSGLC